MTLTRTFSFIRLHRNLDYSAVGGIVSPGLGKCNSEYVDLDVKLARNFFSSVIGNLLSSVNFAF